MQCSTYKSDYRKGGCNRKMLDGYQLVVRDVLGSAIMSFVGIAQFIACC